MLHLLRLLRGHIALRLAGLLLLATHLGCIAKPENEVVIYSAADREFAAPILSAFARRNEGVDLAIQYDIESTKTVGLVTRIQNEAQRTRCDVFWNNEILHTLRLEKEGLLKKVSWDIPRNWPQNMQSRKGTWVGFAARARILLVNTELLTPDEYPSRVEDLANPVFADKGCFASPAYGTTATHFAVLYSRLGKEKATGLFERFKENATVLSGNKQVAQMVASGGKAFGLTDTDDALVEIAAGLPVKIIFPDQRSSEVGTLRIPNSVSVMKDAPHPVAATKLANYLVGEDTEGRLAMGPSGQIPIRPGHPVKSQAEGDAAIRWMDVDFYQAADVWDEVAEIIREMF
ncbi:MAG TPA: iron transporter [Planctomycetaceae bacterium]|nr:iron transporter [Planctomycetaceae bacterium]